MRAVLPAYFVIAKTKQQSYMYDYDFALSVREKAFTIHISLEL